MPIYCVINKFNHHFFLFHHAIFFFLLKKLIEEIKGEFLEMGLASNELNSKSGYGFVQKSISEFLQEIAVIQENGKKLAKINGFVFELENEMKKIRVFKRELPVCMLLLGDGKVFCPFFF